MRLAAGLMALLAGIYCAACMPFVRQDDSIRLLVFNIHAGKDARARNNIADLAKLIRASGADIVLLQEVDRGTNRSGKVDQLQALIDATGFSGTFGQSLEYDGGQYGIAALARGGFIYSETIPLRVTPTQERAGGSHEPRVALLGVAVSPMGRLQTVSTHLDASSTDLYRLQEIAGVLNIVRARASEVTPLLLAGDLNSEPGSAVVRRIQEAGLRDAWAECGRGDGLTYPADRPVKRIDYVWLSGTLRCTAAEVLDTQISDHRPLLVTLDATTEPGAAGPGAAGERARN
jgi:endonuclease/exonuclease/phosphatase family metal-dependent hydrolase